MNPFRHRPFLLLLALAATALGGWLRADDPPASPTPATAPTAPETVVAPQAPAAPVKSSTDDEARRQAEQAKAEGEAAADQARTESEKAAEEARVTAEKAGEEARAAVEEAKDEIADLKGGVQIHSSNDGDRVAVGNDNHVPAEVIVPHDAVAVMGDLTVDGEVKHDAVAVMGDNTINGHVHHNVVAIMGDIKLGPKAVVGGDLICVAGDVHRDPGAVVHGKMQMRTFGPGIRGDSMSNWWDHALKIGRPLAIGAHLGWLWILTGFSVAFYALLGLLFPRRITACGDKLVQEPGLVILSAVLAVLALPVLFVLLCITLIGIPVALFVLPVTCLFVAMFGKAALYGLVGRRITGDRFHPAVAVLLGAVLFVLLYLLPIVGLLLSLLVWFLGFGCAVLMLFGRSKPAATSSVPPPSPAAVPPMPAVAPVVSPVPPPMAEPSFAAVPPVIVEPAPSSPPPPAPSAAAAVAAMVLTADTAPRAGFGIRLAAALLDFVMIVVPVGMMGGMDREGPGLLFLCLAAYHAVMWQLKGTTIGGVICNLKVVRLDDRPIDWGVAIVRALSAFLSLFMAGLGFIWVAFDDEKQSWHDKIAGTTIVKVPKGTSLI